MNQALPTNPTLLLGRRNPRRPMPLMPAGLRPKSGLLAGMRPGRPGMKTPGALPRGPVLPPVPSAPTISAPTAPGTGPSRVNPLLARYVNRKPTIGG